MLTFGYYLLKIIICSGILYGYYIIALRNKIFHKWNRFFLLAAVVLSLAAPLIKINIRHNTDNDKTPVVHFLQVVNSGDEVVYEYTKNNNYFNVNTADIPAIIYFIITCFFLTCLIRTLYKINRLKNKYHQTIIEGINFINTDADGTPFSFFNTIFWNDKIDINTSTGKQIFNHEVAHVQEKHSYDKVFMNIVLILFWINPFFWLIRKELNMIHEFIADEKALEDNDSAAFAAMILQAAYPQQQFTITNNFFYSPLKRRLIMLAKNKNAKVNYVSRLVVLPLAVSLFLAFTLKMKTISLPADYTGKKITVVIDAGHGGDDNGAVVNSINEKDLTLSIAKEIKAMNENENINIILSREKDQTINVKDRVKFAKTNKADLFISIHINAALNKNTESGLDILIPNNGNVYFKESKILGSDLLESFKHDYALQINNDLHQPDKGVWVLNASQCPAILIQPGFLTNQKDLAYLAKPGNQQTIARNILNGIEKYAEDKFAVKYLIENKNDFDLMDTISGNKNEFSFRDTTPKAKSNTNNALIIVDGVEKGHDSNALKSLNPSSIQTINVLKGESAVKKYGTKGKYGVIEIITKSDMKKDTISNHSIYINVRQTDSAYLHGEKIKSALVILNGKEIGSFGEDYVNKLKYPDSVTIINNASAIRLYGNKGINGVIIIAAKNTAIDENKISDNNINLNTDKVFTKVEVEPSFPGGNEAWNRYITKQIQEHIKELSDEGKSATCLVRFIVGIDGTVSDVTVVSMQGTKLAKVAADAIKNGPKWISAKQNDHIVTSYKEQPVTFKMQKSY